MTAPLSNTKHPVLVALALGILGGAALIVTKGLTGGGPLVFLPYSALVLGSLAAVRLAGWPEFSRRFVAAFLAFMVATVVFYVYIAASAGTFLEISVWGHTWRLGFMAGIGGVLSGSVAYLADLGRA